MHGTNDLPSADLAIGAEGLVRRFGDRTAVLAALS